MLMAAGEPGGRGDERASDGETDPDATGGKAFTPGRARRGAASPSQPTEEGRGRAERRGVGAARRSRGGQGRRGAV